MDPTKRKHPSDDQAPDLRRHDWGFVTRQRGETQASYEKRLVEAYGPYIFIRHPTSSQLVHLTEEAKAAKDHFFKMENAKKHRDIQRRQTDAILHDRLQDRPLMTETLYNPKYDNFAKSEYLKQSIGTIERKVSEWSKDRSRLLAIDKLTRDEHESLPESWKKQRQTLRHQVRNAENSLNLLYGQHLHSQITAERSAKLRDQKYKQEQAFKNLRVDALKTFLVSSAFGVDPEPAIPSPAPEIAPPAQAEALGPADYYSLYQQGTRLPVESSATSASPSLHPPSVPSEYDIPDKDEMAQYLPKPEDQYGFRDHDYESMKQLEVPNLHKYDFDHDI